MTDTANKRTDNILKLPLLRAHEVESLKLQVIVRVADHEGNLPVDFRAETDLPFCLSKDHVRFFRADFATIFNALCVNPVNIRFLSFIEGTVIAKLQAEEEAARRERAQQQRSSFTNFLDEEPRPQIIISPPPEEVLPPLPPPPNGYPWTTGDSASALQPSQKAA